MASRSDPEFRVRFLAAAAVAAAALVGACSDDRAPERPKTTGSHVWRGQTDMLFEAKEQARDVASVFTPRYGTMRTATRTLSLREPRRSDSSTR